MEPYCFDCSVKSICVPWPPTTRFNPNMGTGGHTVFICPKCMCDVLPTSAVMVPPDERCRVCQCQILDRNSDYDLVCRDCGAVTRTSRTQVPNLLIRGPIAIACALITIEYFTLMSCLASSFWSNLPFLMSYLHFYAWRPVSGVFRCCGKRKSMSFVDLSVRNGITASRVGSGSKSRKTFRRGSRPEPVSPSKTFDDSVKSGDESSMISLETNLPVSVTNESKASELPWRTSVVHLNKSNTMKTVMDEAPVTKSLAVDTVSSMPTTSSKKHSFVPTMEIESIPSMSQSSDGSPSPKPAIDMTSVILGGNPSSPNLDYHTGISPVLDTCSQCQRQHPPYRYAIVWSDAKTTNFSPSVDLCRECRILRVESWATLGSDTWKVKFDDVYFLCLRACFAAALALRPLGL